MAVSEEPSVKLSSKLDKMFLRAALPICVVVDGTSISALVSQCHFNAHMHSGDALWVLDSHSVY